MLLDYITLDTKKSNVMTQNSNPDRCIYLDILYRQAHRPNLTIDKYFISNISFYFELIFTKKISRVYSSISTFPRFESYL